MKQWQIWGALALGMVFLAVNAGAATAYFYDASRADVIARGVTIGGIPVGGLSDEAAKAELQHVLDARLGRPLVLRYGDRTFRLDPRQAGFLGVDVDAVVAEAVAASRRGNLLNRFIRDVRGRPLPEQIDLGARIAPSAIEQAVANLAATLDRPARSAAVVASATALRRVPARWGVAVRRAALEQLLRRVIVDPSAPRELGVPVRPLKPAVTTAALRHKYAAFITVDREHFRLTFWKNLRRYKTYPIAVGRAGLETPAGLYHINDKQIDPWWHVPNSAWAGSLAGKVIPPGPQDPIKARWMGFWDGAGVHGTDDIGSLGSAASHGCVRMSITDVEQLYELVPLGTPIYVG